MPVVVTTGHGVQTCRKLRRSPQLQWRDGMSFFGPCTQVHGQGFPPPSGRGRGGGDAGSLLPGVLPPELVASYARAWSDTPCRQSFVPPTPPLLTLSLLPPPPLRPITTTTTTTTTPIVQQLHRFMIAVSRVAVNHGERGGYAADPLVWDEGSNRKQRKTDIS